MLVSAHATAQLVQLSQPEHVGPVDDDRVGVRDVQAGLDDRCADQDVDASLHELAHHPGQPALRHLPVAHYDRRLRHKFPKPVGHCVNGLHAIVNEEHLAVAGHLVEYGLADSMRVVAEQARVDGQSVARRRLQRGDVPDADQGQVQRSRDRRGG